ncbi:MAG: response regulator transcription factor [Azospirillaceae bacterium]
MSQKVISTILVSGDRLFREAFKQLSGGLGIDVVDEAAGVAELAESTADRKAPDLVILLGWTVGDEAFQAAVARLRETWSSTRMLVLTDSTDAALAQDALRAGVDGLLHRNMSSEALVHAIMLVMLGEEVLPAKLAQRLISGAGTPMPAGAKRQFEGLTPREIDILELLSEGAPNKVIANQLGTTEATVKVQLRRILRQIGVQNRTQAAIWALQHLNKGAYAG